jgi:integrating conjugative element protein (TIGR03749 family)
MKQILKHALPILTLTFFSVSNVSATEIIHYEDIPVAIELRQGDERTKGQQQKKLFRVQSAQGSVHFLPYQAFDKQRVQIKRISDGRIILIDLVALKEDKTAAKMEDVRILLESENIIAADLNAEDEATEPEMPIITPVDLTRYASQLLYGPARLHKDLPGITETTLGVEGAIRLFKGANKYRTVSRSIIAYQGGGYYLAGIHIKNISADRITLSYLDINIPFSHATFQHHSLSSNGSPGDSTVIYIVSETPLKEALYPWTYYQDMKADAEDKRRTSRAESNKASALNRSHIKK